MDSFFANLENCLTGSTDISLIRYRIMMFKNSNTAFHICSTK